MLAEYYSLQNLFGEAPLIGGVCAVRHWTFYPAKSSLVLSQSGLRHNFWDQHLISRTNTCSEEHFQGSIPCSFTGMVSRLISRAFLGSFSRWIKNVSRIVLWDNLKNDLNSICVGIELFHPVLKATQLITHASVHDSYLSVQVDKCVMGKSVSHII